MPRADRFISSRFARNASKTAVRSKVLMPLEALSLSNGLQADAVDLYYSGWVSFLDAFNGIRHGFYTWATVKLYYSVFYTFRCALAQAGLCAFYVDDSSYTVIAQPGESPVSSTDRGTHKTVLKAFQRRNTVPSLVSQQIALEDAVDWLMHRRETANYGEPRFSEPECRGPLEYVASIGLRKAVNAYLAEPTFLYVFDPDHAILAYPLRALGLIGTNLIPMTADRLSSEEQRFLKDGAADGSGAFPSLLAEMKRVMLLK